MSQPLFTKNAKAYTACMNTEHKNSAQNVLSFIKKSPSCFHVIKNLSEELKANGFESLDERKEWKLHEGGKYFVIRNNSSIISFKIPKTPFGRFMITSSHSDSPSFKIKENPEIKAAGYIKLNVEKYGGMIIAPWFDRPLSVAGRLIIKSKSEDNRIHLQEKLIDIDRDLVLIPNLAIHMNRDVNDGAKINVQNEVAPIFTADSGTDNKSLIQILAEAADVDAESVVSSDLFLYNRTAPTFWGKDNEFIASTKLDDLECAYTTFKGFLAAENTDAVTMHCVFDNEEVGSLSRQGADSTFLRDTLERISNNLGRTHESFLATLANSFMVSADNAHALHPNYSDKADPVNRPAVNKGIVIKFNAAQKYTSDAISSAFFKQVCQNAGVPYQIFTNNSNIAGGSTLGNISNSHVSIPSVDIGLAQWAMHSPYESAGALDPLYMEKAITAFYGSTFELES